MLLVTGASGTVGREVVERLPPGQPARVLLRDPARAGAVTGRPGVQIVPGDYDDRRSLAAAMAGVRAVFLVTCDPSRPEQDQALVDAARAAGVRHLVKLSALAVSDPEADDLITRWQRASEERVRASGLHWTLLRPRAFMSNALHWADSVRTASVVRALHGTAPHTCVDPRDVARVAVRALTGTGHEGRTYALTGPEPVSPAQQAGMLAQVLGRPLRFEELSEEQARQSLLRRYPPELAEALLASAARQRDGGKALVTGTVARLTGRAPGSFQAWARDHARAFGSPTAVAH